MGLQRSADTPAEVGSAAIFTGTVRFEGRFAAESPGRMYGAIVAFSPGARTHWHTHPLGQTLVVTVGVGWTQCEGGPKVEIRAGDIISCPCGRRHWHGATPTTAMTHVAISELLDGKGVDWMEPVTDEEYLAGAPVRT